MDMKKILQAMDSASTKPVEGSSDMAKFLSVMTEGATPHKVALPVQMAMQHYQAPKIPKKPKVSVISKYFTEAETAMAEEQENKKHLMRQYASVIAERVMMKENRTDEIAGAFPDPTNETPIEMDPAEPNNPVVHSHQKANPMQLKSRIVQARNQLRELADMAESNDLVVWEKITQLAKGGMFMGLEQNLEQIRHGIHELATKRKQGGIHSRGIDKNIG